MAAARKAGLGRGLEALLPSDAAHVVSGFARVAVDAIVPNPDQPREHFDEEALAALTASITEVGVLQPIVVRPAGSEGTHVLVAGERRWRAARRAGLDEIPVIIRQGDDASRLTEAIIENVQREDLGPLEEAAAYQQLMEDFSMTHDQVGGAVGRSRSAVTNSVRLLNLPGSIQALLTAGALSAGHGRALVPLDDIAYAEQLAATAAEEGWSVRQVEDAVRARIVARDEAADAVIPHARRAEVLELEERLADRLGTTVRIDYGARGGGKLTIRFGSLDELEQIYTALLGE